MTRIDFFLPEGEHPIKTKKILIYNSQTLPRSCLSFRVQRCTIFSYPTITYCWENIAYNIPYIWDLCVTEIIRIFALQYINME